MSNKEKSRRIKTKFINKRFAFFTVRRCCCVGWSITTSRHMKSFWRLLDVFLPLALFLKLMAMFWHFKPFYDWRLECCSPTKDMEAFLWPHTPGLQLIKLKNFCIKLFSRKNMEINWHSMEFLLMSSSLP